MEVNGLPNVLEVLLKNFGIKQIAATPEEYFRKILEDGYKAALYRMQCMLYCP